jgi:hypothetical protein
MAAVVAANMSLPIEQAANDLVAKYGEAQRARAERGVKQVAGLWRAEDGDAAAFTEFVKTHFAGDPQTLDALFARMELAFESLDGHMLDIGRDWRSHSDLDLGPILPFDEIMAGYDPSAHIHDDLFANKLAFVVLLNFPLTTLEERLANGDQWSRRQWAEARLGLRFGRRVPAEVNTAIAQAIASANQYVAGYNIWMGHVADEKGRRLFPADMRLLEHWNLRDEIKSDYADAKDGLAKQRTIARVLERIVDQSIPKAVIDNPKVEWNPFTNEITGTASDREPDARYATILATFRASKLADPYSPNAPTLIARRFDQERELPEARVTAMLEEVLGSPLVARVAKLIEQRLGRPLQPFDIWYDGFRGRDQYPAGQLDEATRKRYPDAAAYAKDMPRMFEQLGFSPERARELAANIVVDPARGSGHAFPAGRRGDHPHLRTRIGAKGMDYKGYNIAVHEMGHNVEQTFSLEHVDHTQLAGVPNSAFTEALAFVFQNRDLELLGLAKPSAESAALKTLNDFWGTYEISGVALVDMKMWHWMYDHPEATPAQLREAVVQISKDVWNRWYAPHFHTRDSLLLGVYAHMVDYPLYLADYPVGHMIAFQIDEQIDAQMEKGGSVGSEFERMATFGNVTPDLWMRHATGAPVGPKALLDRVESILRTRSEAKGTKNLR